MTSCDNVGWRIPPELTSPTAIPPPPFPQRKFLKGRKRVEICRGEKVKIRLFDWTTTIMDDYNIVKTNLLMERDRYSIR